MLREELTCPSCGSIADLYEITYAGTPDCPNCGHTFEEGNDDDPSHIPSIANLLLAKNRVMREQSWKPLLTSVKDPDKHGNGRVVVRTSPSKMLIALLIIFGMFGRSVYKTGMGETLKAIADFSITDPMYMVYFVVGLGLLAYVLWRTIITVTDEGLRISRGPLFSFGKGRLIPFEEIKRLSVNVRQTSSGSSGSSKTVRLVVLRTSGKSRTAFRGRIQLDTYFIEKTLHIMMAKRYEPFPRCWLELESSTFSERKIR